MSTPSNFQPVPPPTGYSDPLGWQGGPSPVPPPKKHRTTFAWLAGGAVACVMSLLIGVALGTATADPGQVAPVPGVTKTVQGATVTPDSCLRALDLADEGFGYASDALTAAQHGFEAVSELDTDKLLAANDDLVATSSKISGIANDYNTYKAQCRGTAS